MPSSGCGRTGFKDGQLVKPGLGRPGYGGLDWDEGGDRPMDTPSGRGSGHEAAQAHVRAHQGDRGPGPIQQVGGGRMEPQKQQTYWLPEVDHPWLHGKIGHPDGQHQLERKVNWDLINTLRAHGRGTKEFDIPASLEEAREGITPNIIQFDDDTFYYKDTGKYYKRDGTQVESPSPGAKPIPQTVEAKEGGRIGFKKGNGAIGSAEIMLYGKKL